MATAKRRGKKAPAKVKARRPKAPAKKRLARAGRARAGKAPARKTRAAKPRAAAKRAAGTGAAAAEVAKLKARFDRERGQLEKRLTETVREIGQLRHHEMRATQLERLLGERDRTIATLQEELEGLRSRAATPSRETQLSLDVGSHEPGDLDDLDDTVALDDEDDDLM